MSCRKMLFYVLTIGRQNLRGKMGSQLRSTSDYFHFYSSLGFISAIYWPFMQFDYHLVTVLVERWQPEMHTFHFHIGEIMKTL